jgi:hypothetical protein
MKPQREDVEGVEFVEDGGLAYSVRRSKSGRLVVVVRCYGELKIDGETYTWDRDEIHISLKKDK